MTRGDVWLAQLGRKNRPVLVLTRPEVIDVRERITVAEITTKRRGLAAEVEFDHIHAGLRERSVVNCDGIHTVRRSMLTKQVGAVSINTMNDVCRAISYGLGC